jgi:hypothetical protein
LAPDPWTLMNPSSTASIKRTARPLARHRETPRANHAELTTPDRQTPNRDQGELAEQHLTIVLEGITATDYLAWVRDPEPHALGRELHSVSAQADPLGELIEVRLQWNTEPPAPPAAAPAAGFYLTPEVLELRTSPR